MSIDKYALCIGINRYSNASANLSGCVNDAHDWADVLSGRGYEVELLLDSAATRANIVTALDRLVEKMGYRDRLVVTFSGHGSWVPDKSGDEEDGRDEVLVTHEMSYVGDDDLELILSKKPFGSRITILSDSCHSGSVNRFAGLQTEKTRFLPPDYIALNEEQQEVLNRAWDARPRSFTGSRHSVLISGCADFEFSYDAWFGPRPNGAFTRTAIDRLQPDHTIRGWHRSIREVLPNERYPQTPQLSASYYQSRWRVFE